MSGRSSLLGFMNLDKGMRSRMGSTSLMPMSQHSRLLPADPRVMCGMSRVKSKISRTRKKCLAKLRLAMISSSSSRRSAYAGRSGSGRVNFEIRISSSSYLLFMVALLSCLAGILTNLCESIKIYSANYRHNLLKSTRPIGYIMLYYYSVVSLISKEKNNGKNCKRNTHRRKLESGICR